MERRKRISSQSLAIAVLSIMLVFAMIAGSTGAWFSSVDSGSLANQTFGTIELGEIGTSPITITVAETGGEVMPGDTVDVSFAVNNTGTADMYIRFQLQVIDPIDSSVIANGDADYPFTADVNALTVVADDIQGVGGVAGATYTFDAGADAGYYYRDSAMTDEAAAVEYIDLQLTISDYLDESYEGSDFAMSLVVEAVQVANNGTGVADAEWATSSGLWSPESI